MFQIKVKKSISLSRKNLLYLINFNKYYLRDLKAAFNAPKPGIVTKPLPEDRPHAGIMDNILLQTKVDLDKYLCDKFLRDINKRKPAAVKFHYARDFDQFPIDLEKVMDAAKERVQGDYLPLLGKLDLFLLIFI